MFNPLQFYREVQRQLKKGQLILELHEYLGQENATVMRLVWFPTGQISKGEPQAEQSVRIKDIAACNYAVLAGTVSYVVSELEKSAKNAGDMLTRKGFEQALKKSEE